MKLLALDTATELCSAALVSDGQVVYRDAFAPRSHTELILPMVDELLSEMDLGLRQIDALVFDRGPGAFTGVRIATSIVQGLALGAELPVIGLSSLAALAQGAYRLRGAQRALAAIDARMGEVYWACFRLQNQVMEPEGTEQVSAPSQLVTPGAARYFGIGTGWDSYAGELMKNPQVKIEGYMGTHYPHAVDLLSLAIPLYRAQQWCDPMSVAPEYVRNDVVSKKTGS